MPELSKPLIAVIGVIVSIAVLFIAILGILPFLQGTVSGVGETAQFTVAASSATSKNANGIQAIAFTVNVQRLSGTGVFQVTSVLVYDPNGNQVVVSGTDPSLPFSFESAASFTAVVTGSGPYPSGDWIIAVQISDANGNPVQTVSVSVPVVG